MNLVPVTDFNAPELDVYARLNEIQLFRYNEPYPGLFLAESPNVIIRALQAGYEPVSFLIEEKRVSAEMTGLSSYYTAFSDVPVYTASLEILHNLTGFPMTRGVLCAMKRKENPSVFSICQHARRIAILEDVENPTNVGAIFRSAAGLGIDAVLLTEVGAIFRSAAGLGVDAVLLTEGCSDPLYRRASRVSMGTVFQVPWTFIHRETIADPDLLTISAGLCKSHPSDLWPDSGITFLRNLGFKTIGMALCDNSIQINDPVLQKEEKLAIILGAEGSGLLPETLGLCDFLVKIPMAHGVDSLNVAAASAVAFWELTKGTSSL